MFLRTVLKAIILLAMFIGPACAASKSDAPKSLGTFGDWNAFTSNENGQTICYMTLKTHGLGNKKVKRDTVWLRITHRPAENSKDVVSYTSGYNFKPASDVIVEIGKENFNLFTQKDTAWSRDAMTDRLLATAIRKNAKMTVTGIPAVHGSMAIIDTIDLKGAVAAHKAITKACGLPVDESPKPAKAAKKAPAQKKKHK